MGKLAGSRDGGQGGRGVVGRVREDGTRGMWKWGGEVGKNLELKLLYGAGEFFHSISSFPLNKGKKASLFIKKKRKSSTLKPSAIQKPRPKFLSTPPSLPLAPNYPLNPLPFSSHAPNPHPPSPPLIHESRFFRRRGLKLECLPSGTNSMIKLSGRQHELEFYYQVSQKVLTPKVCTGTRI